MKGTKADVGLYVSTERSGDGYFHIWARVVLLNTDRPGSILNPRDELVNGLWLHDLTARSQGHEFDGYGPDRRKNLDPNLYGWDAIYDRVHSVDRRAAEGMAKTLKKIERGFAKIYDARGRAKSYGEFVARLGEVLKAKKMVFPVHDGRSGWSYADHEHWFLSLDEGRDRIDALEAEWKKSVNPAAVEAATA